MSDKPTPPQHQDKKPAAPEPGEGSNATQHAPDPKAEPIADGEHKYVPKSPFAPRQ